MSYVCDLFFNFSLVFVVINHKTSFKLTYLFLHIFQNISYYFWMMMWMKKATNFEIVKVQAEDVAQLLLDLFVNFSLLLLIKVVLIKKACIYTFLPPLRDDTHMTSMKIVQFSRPPTQLVQLSPNLIHHLGLGRPISNEPLPHLQVIPKKLKENIIQRWLLYLIRSFL